MKDYTLLDVLPRLKFDYGMMEFIDGARDLRFWLQQRIGSIEYVDLREDNYELDVKDLLSGDEDARNRFIARHCETMTVACKATLGIFRPEIKSIYYSLRCLFDEYRNWKFEAAIDESRMNIDASYLDTIREAANLYSTIKQVDMTADIFEAYFKEKLAGVIFEMYRKAFLNQLELFTSMYDGELRGARISLLNADSGTACYLEILMEKDDGV